MRKAVLLLFMMCIALCSTACGSAPSESENYTPLVNGNYVYDGDVGLTVADRSFSLEDIPESSIEEIVVKDFLYTITAELDSKYEILADIESNHISIENEKKNFENGCYMQSYVLHEIHTLTSEQYEQEKMDNGETNMFYYYGWGKIVQNYALVEYEVINVVFTQTWSPEAMRRGPQWGNGTHTRSFIVGKTVNDNSYKIYDFGFM